MYCLPCSEGCRFQFRTRRQRSDVAVGRRWARARTRRTTGRPHKQQEVPRVAIELRTGRIDFPSGTGLRAAGRTYLVDRLPRAFSADLIEMEVVVLVVGV